MVLILDRFKHLDSKNKLHTQNGVTLLETVITIFIIAVMIVALIDIYLVYNATSNRAMVVNNMNYNLNNGSVLIRNLVSKADVIKKQHVFTTALLCTSSATPTTTCSTTQDVLVLQIPSLDSSQNPTSTFDNAVIYLADGIDSDTKKDEIWYSLEASPNTYRTSIYNRKIASSIDALGLIFRYNHVDPTQSTNVQIFIKSKEIAYTHRIETSSAESNTLVSLRNR